MAALGLIMFQKSEPAALFTIALCSMWPTVINTMSGVKSIPQEYWNVAKVLRLSRFQTFTKVLVPATLPYMFTGYRLSLGIAWLVIVASEMLTGTPGVGGFLWQEYNSLIYAHILLVHSDHRCRRVPARPHDGNRRSPVAGDLTMAFIEVRNFEIVRIAVGRATFSIDVSFRSSEGEFVSIVGFRGAARRR